MQDLRALENKAWSYMTSATTTMITFTTRSMEPHENPGVPCSMPAGCGITESLTGLASQAILGAIAHGSSAVSCKHLQECDVARM